MSLHPRPKPDPKSAEVPGLSYYNALPSRQGEATSAKGAKSPLQALNEMYAYYSEE